MVADRSLLDSTLRVWLLRAFDEPLIELELYIIRAREKSDCLDGALEHANKGMVENVCEYLEQF